MDNTETRPHIGPVQIGAVLLALAAAGIHLYLFIIEGYLGSGTMLPVYQLLFVGNFGGFVTLAIALVLPIYPLPQVRPVTRTLLIAIPVASIASYFHVGVRDTLGDITQVIEVLLIVALIVNAAMSGKEFGGGYARGVLGAAVQLTVGIVAGVAMFLFLRPLLV